VPVEGKRRRLSRRRLLGLDRSGPEPPQTRAGQPLRPFTLPNLIGYIRLIAIPIFLIVAFNSGDGRDPVAALIFLAIALGDLLDGFVARVTGQYSRLGALLDPVVDRLTILAGAVVCWNFELLPRVAIAILAVREVATLILARYGLRHGVDLEITWVGRIAVFLVMGGIFWSMVVDWAIIRVGFCVGVALAVLATVLYVRAAMRQARRNRENAASEGSGAPDTVHPGVQPSSSD
jgi:phosphatidylglycerophosphate synthase